MDNIDRQRSVDLKKLSVEEADQISRQIGMRVRDMVDLCVVQVNRLLAVYGLEAKMQIVIQEKDAPQAKTPKKRSRTKKTSNL